MLLNLLTQKAVNFKENTEQPQFNINALPVQCLDFPSRVGVEFQAMQSARFYVVQKSRDVR